MKKLLYIFIIIILSCESGGDLSEHQGIAYQDCLAFGWQDLFDGDYENALNWFNTAYDAIDEDYHNSAYTGLGFTYLFISNYGSEEELAICGGMDDCRDAAFEEFLYDVDRQDAIASYDADCIFFQFCCDDCFVQDNRLGILFHDIAEARDEEDQNAIQTLASQLQGFIDDNGTDYYFRNGKPTGTDGETVDWDIGTPAVYLANLYYSMGESKTSCELLLEYNLSCDILDCDDFYFEDLIDCIESQNPF